MRFRLDTLVTVLALGPMVLGGMLWTWPSVRDAIWPPSYAEPASDPSGGPPRRCTMPQSSVTGVMFLASPGLIVSHVSAIAWLKLSVRRMIRWQPSMQVGEPDSLLGLPVYTSEYAPTRSQAGSMSTWQAIMAITGLLTPTRFRFNRLLSCTPKRIRSV